MRHRVSKPKLNRPGDHRRAMLRNLMTSLFLHEKVQTTDARARVLSSLAEKLITRVKAQKEEFNAIRELNRVLTNPGAAHSALEFSKKLKRTSGFTRMTKIRQRVGDGALIVQVDLIADKK